MVGSQFQTKKLLNKFGPANLVLIPEIAGWKLRVDTSPLSEPQEEQ